MLKRMIPLGHVETDVTQRSGTHIHAKAVGILRTRNPVVFLDDVLAFAILSMNQIIGSLRRRPDHVVGVVGGHRAQA